MAEVENDTEEGVDYSYNEGQGTSGISLFKALEPGQVKPLDVANKHFNIYFYQRSEKGKRAASYERKILAKCEGVPKESRVRLYCPTLGRPSVEVRSVTS